MLANLKIIFMLLAGPAFLIGAAGYLIVRLKLRPDSQEIEQTYWEFEDAHPSLQRFHLWSRITLFLIFLSMLLMFLAIAL